MPGPSVDLSVVIPALNGQAVIREQLDALASQHTDLAWEVIVADNGSTDRTKEIVAEVARTYPVSLIAVDASDRRGAGHARNVGAGVARGAVLAFCDCDDAVGPGWVNAAWRGVQESPSVVGPLRDMAHAPDTSAPIVNDAYQAGRDIQSGNFAIRRATFFDVGGFDTSLPPYGCEDSELALRMRKAGFEIRGAPDMGVWFRVSEGGRRLRKIHTSGMAEAVVWHRHRDIFDRQLRSVASGAELLCLPLDIAREVLRRRPPSAAWLARTLVTRLGHLRGYWTWIRGGRAAEPRLAGPDPRAD